MAPQSLSGNRAGGPPGAGLVLQSGLDQAAVHPPDVGQTPMVRGAVLGATPGCLGSEIELAESGRLAGGIGSALKMGAFLTHRHPDLVPRPT